MKVNLILFIVFLSFCSSCFENKTKNQEINKDLLLQKARENYNANNFSLALKLLDSLITIDTTEGEAYYMRGYCKDQIYKDFHSSSDDYKKSISLNYKKSSALYNLGLSEMALFRDSLALIYFKEAHKIDSNDKEISTLIKTCENNLLYSKSHVYKNSSYNVNSNKKEF